MVIGAGLAGSAVAQVMAQAGWLVTVVDQAEQPAQAASGNLAGLVHPLLTADWNIRSQFYWQGLQATWRWVADWVEQGQVIGDLSGLRQALLSDEDLQISTKWLTQLDIPREWVRVEAASSANQPAGLVYRQAGWLSPPSLVQRALDHPSIRFQGGLEVEALVWHASSQQWHIRSGATTLNADAVVIATGALSRLNQAWQLPIRPLKGQVSYMNQQDCPYPLTGAMAHQGYTTPPVNGYWVTGATFEAPDVSQTTSLASHQSNAEKLAAVIPDWGLPAASLWQGRVGFRPTTADHLPIIGALPDADWVEKAYLSQPHNKALFQYPAQRYHPALWVSQGHGARGLMSVWWAAERIRDQILGVSSAAADAESEMNRLDAAVHPGRFRLRPWRKGQLSGHTLC
ncbi:FAD-dependent cmnm(5)s(2)U34 oxidoreductase [Thiomicrospira aerophila AL3]|uniref:FAD-dependent cmnm(5)s(2)U34 oxidoreductase n=1 Tax=Thiomicrospira aerophila AL3 TaxID=717772 RepID=W0DPL8_9GAMM|nr:FAD-dependent cmnm(5)s(2)U34 oxidoreductase [Thiomicrospira aerophila AL3]